MATDIDNGGAGGGRSRMRRFTAQLRGGLVQGFAATRHFRPVLLLVVALFIGFSVTTGDFCTKDNIENMLTAVSVLWMASIGMTFVLLAGGADLSVGAIAGLVGIFMAKLLGLGLPGGVVVILAILFGAVVGGAVNGMLIGIGKLSFFVVTLASMTTLTGVVSLWSKTQSFFVTSPLVSKLGVGEIASVPTPIWLMAATFVVGLYLQKQTYFGRDIYAVGGSTPAARLSGIRVSRTIIMVYAISGGCAALAGILSTGRIGAATPTVDTSLALQAIAAVLLGGTSLFGGSGGVGGTVFGVLFIGILNNGLSIAGVQSFWQQVVTGLILVAAICGDRISMRRLRTSPTFLATRARRRAAP